MLKEGFVLIVVAAQVRKWQAPRFLCVTNAQTGAVMGPSCLGGGPLKD